MSYQKRLKKLLDENLIDIILFGSFVKEGSANDIDVALVLNKKIDINNIKKKLKEILNEKLDIQTLYLKSIYSPIWLTLIKEGFSINKGNFLFEIYNIKPSVLYKYSLKKLNNVQKVQFNRGLKKVLGKEGSLLTRSVILVPLKIKNDVMEFLKKWGIYYESDEYELIPLLRKEEFL